MRRPILHTFVLPSSLPSPFADEWATSILPPPPRRRSTRRLKPFASPSVTFLDLTPIIYGMGFSADPAPPSSATAPPPPPQSVLAPPPPLPPPSAPARLPAVPIWGSDSDVTTKVDWKETDAAHVLMIEVPGLKKEDVKVQVEARDILKVSAEVKREGKESGDMWRLKERMEGKLLRKFKLTGSPIMDEIQAKVEDGLLVVTVPKEATKAVHIC